jgi:hypothetical protein
MELMNSALNIPCVRLVSMLVRGVTVIWAMAELLPEGARLPDRKPEFAGGSQGKPVQPAVMRPDGEFYHI